jgi:hypothetical protein
MVSFGNIQFLRLTFILLFFTILGRNLFSANQYWDRDNGAAGATSESNSSATGNWGDSNWNSNADGSGSNGTWSNGNTAIFSAGSDATGSSTITANLNATLGGLTVEEGDITIASGSGSLTFSDSPDFNVADGSTLTINEALNYGNNNYGLTKTGKGLLTIGDDNTVDGMSTTEITQGKIDISSGVTFTGGIEASGTLKSMLGGDGIVDSATFGNNAFSYEIDFVSPGLGLSSSMTDNTSKQQLSAADDERSSGAEAVGSLTVTTLTLNGGTIYDWEIADFSPGTSNKGTAYDVLKYGSIAFESGQKIGVNILAVQNSNGAAGRFNNFSNAGNNYSDANGFHFLQSTTGDHASNGPTSQGDASSYFDLYTDSFDYYYGPGVGSWGVWYDGSGDFYLTYSAVPEPSTYIMISALFLVIGFNQSSRKTLHSMIASLRTKFSKNPKQPVSVELK